MKKNLKNVTVLELIEALQDINDPQRIVIISSDSEGNNYSLIGQLELGRYLEDDINRGQVFPDMIETGDKALIIYPSH